MTTYVSAATNMKCCTASMRTLKLNADNAGGPCGVNPTQQPRNLAARVSIQQTKINKYLAT